MWYSDRMTTTDETRPPFNPQNVVQHDDRLVYWMGTNTATRMLADSNLPQELARVVYETADALMADGSETTWNAAVHRAIGLTAREVGWNLR